MTDQKIDNVFTIPQIAPSPIFFTPQQVIETAKASASKTSHPRSSAKRMMHQLAMPKLEPMGVYVGQLKDRWQFPSDHLPIGMTMEDINIASWNVLDAVYMNWVTEKDSQGLNGSMITDEHVYIGDSKLTVRDKHIAKLISEMILDPNYPRSILSLQECSGPFLEELKATLPEHFEVIAQDGNAIVFDKSRFELLEAKAVQGVFSGDARTFQDVLLQRVDNGEMLRIINAHLPGDPTGPARFEFMKYLHATFDPRVATCAMGDMNFNEIEMADALRRAFPKKLPFKIFSPYCTNISPVVFNSKAIDHFFVYSPNKPYLLEANQPEDVMAGLDAIVDLLSGNERPQVSTKALKSAANF